MRHIVAFVSLWCFTILFGLFLLSNGAKLESLATGVEFDDSVEATSVKSASIVDTPVALDMSPAYITLGEAFEVFGQDASGDLNSHLTAGDFLNLLAHQGRYIIDTDSGPVYLLGDSNFMTQSEFDALFSDFDRIVQRDEFERIMAQIQACDNFLDVNCNITNASAYEDLLWGYYREFWDLYNTNPNSGKYWLHDAFSGEFGRSSLSRVLHELAHEESARLSYGYSHRSCRNHDWSVVWYDNIQSMHPYNIKTHDFVEIGIRDFPRTCDVLDFGNISQSVRDTVYFRTYVDRKDVISNLFSIYGMTEEFCANMIDVKFAVISDVIDYDGIVLSDDDLRPYYFWTSLICEYILSLKEQDYSSYEALLSDSNLMGLLQDVYGCIDEYVSMLGVNYSNTWDSVALKSWYESPRVQMAIAEYLKSGS